MLLADKQTGCCESDACKISHMSGTDNVKLSFIMCYVFISLFVYYRVKKCVFPIIPDPKNAFYDLYDSQNGYDLVKCTAI